MKNNKGFMLAEVVIVSAVLITTIVGLYSGFANTYKAYEIRSSYYDAKTVYALKNLEDFLIDEMLLNNINTIPTLPKLDAEDFSNDYHKAFITEFITTYNMDSIYILEYSENSINSFKTDKDEEFKNYIDFYIDKEKEDDDSINEEDYDYLLVAVTKDGRYSSLRIK